MLQQYKLFCAVCSKECIDRGNLKRSNFGKIYCNSKECQKIKRRLRYDRDKEKENRAARERIKKYREEGHPYITWHNKYIKKWYAQNRDDQLIKKKVAWQNNREEWLEYKRGYNALPEKKRQKIKWCKENYTHILDYRKEYRNGKGKMVCKLISNRRRRKLDNVIHNFTAEQLQEKFDALRGVCPECGKYAGDDLTLEHIVPISRVPLGHVYELDGMTFLCKSCNSSKRAKLYDEWVDYKNEVFAD